jgi:hypothetical protein
MRSLRAETRKSGLDRLRPELCPLLEVLLVVPDEDLLSGAM